MSIPKIGRRRWGALVLGVLLCLAGLPAGALTAGAQTNGLVTSANRALRYLATQQQSDGSIDHSASETEDFILGTAAAGRNPNRLVAPSGASVYDFLAANLAQATADANRTGKLVQALVAGRRTPRNFAGQNVLARLEGPGGTAGGFYDPATGAFDNGVNATFHQSNAILGLVSANDPAFPVTGRAVRFLVSLQDTTGEGVGGWPADGVDNTNSTAMAVMALASVHRRDGVAAALGFLHTQQDPDSGGFAFTTLGPFGSTASDPDSDALVIQGLVAVRQDPGSPVWTNGSGNALTDIVTFQDPATGGFAFLRGIPPDAFTTSFVPAGLLERPFPIVIRR